MQNSNTPKFLKVAVKKLFFSHVEGMDFGFTVGQVVATVENYRKIYNTTPTEWLGFLDVMDSRMKVLLQYDFDAEEIYEMTMVELRDKLDEVEPMTIVVVNGTPSGGKSVNKIELKKAA